MGRVRDGPVAMRWTARVATVAAYVAVFWLLLPALLWTAAVRLDDASGWSADPRSVGYVFGAAGAGLMAWAIAELWRRGRGLPVGAMPPERFTRSGPYRLARHPIYLGFDVAVFGAGLAAGSPALAWVVAPLFAPVWIAYALLEERGLERRFGEAYRRYRRQVGLLPGPGLYRLSQLLMACRLIPVEVRGRENVPRSGPVILVHNHASYLDPAFVGSVTRRPIHFLTTAEAYRRGFKRWIVRHFVNFPVRRYRVDPIACREMIRLLAEGEVVGDSAEGERTPDGGFQGSLPQVARVLSRIPVPVIPVGVSGAYDTGPRWSDRVRRRPVSVRVGRPIRWDGDDPVAALDAALVALIDPDPQPVHLGGLDRRKLERVLWRCPECGDEAGWSPADLACARCRSRFRPAPGGLFEDADGAAWYLADLAEAVREWPEDEPLRARAVALREESLFGPIRPLRRAGEGTLEIDRREVRFRDLRLGLEDVRSTTTERADTLQVVTRSGMWQFRLLEGSAFRAQLAVERWRREVEAAGVGRRAHQGRPVPSRRLLALFEREAAP